MTLTGLQKTTSNRQLFSTKIALLSWGHREGTITFAALSGKAKSIELVIKGLMGVPERVFNWDLP